MTSISQRWDELLSMTNTEDGRARLQLEYLRIAANLSASALAVLAVGPVRMAEAILDHEFPPHVADEELAERSAAIC